MNAVDTDSWPQELTATQSSPSTQTHLGLRQNLLCGNIKYIIEEFFILTIWWLLLCVNLTELQGAKVFDQTLSCFHKHVSG